MTTSRIRPVDQSKSSADQLPRRTGSRFDQVLIAAFSSAERGCFGAFRRQIRCQIGLSSGLPGTTPAPLSPPARSFPPRSGPAPPLASSPEWQVTHFDKSKGAIDFSKETGRTSCRAVTEVKADPSRQASQERCPKLCSHQQSPPPINNSRSS